MPGRTSARLVSECDNRQPKVLTTPLCEDVVFVETFVKASFANRADLQRHRYSNEPYRLPS